MSHYFYDLTHFRGQGRNTEIFSFLSLVQMKTSKSHSEIIRHLKLRYVLSIQKVEERLRDFQTKSYHENAKAPPVRSEGMPFTTDYLGSHILDGTTKGIGLVFQILLGQAEVRHGNVTIGVEKKAMDMHEKEEKNEGIKLFFLHSMI